MAEYLTTREDRWAAVAGRNAEAEGAFVYGVRTTAVYCRPGCASRLPKRENVAFFDTAGAAEAAGFRPCRRCRPDRDSPRRHRAEVIARACRRIDTAEEAPSLDELAAEAGLSRWHFHRVFKAALGVTPKQYAQARRMDRFRNGLAVDSSVTEAIYDAGFSSSSRAYENAATSLGMTPSAYKDGAAGLTIRHAAATCFLGPLLVAATGRGICAIEFGNDVEALVGRLRHRFPKARLEAADSRFSALVDRVVSLIDTPDARLRLPLDVQGTAFQQRVWAALRRIPPGTTATYAEIARRIGRPKAARAVGQACAANSVAVAVPCHRAVRGDGNIGGYRWGTARKRALLKREDTGSAERE